MYLKIAEICEMLKISKPTLYRMIKAGNFPKPTKMGVKSRWHEDMVNRWINIKGIETYGNIAWITRGTIDTHKKKLE